MRYEFLKQHRNEYRPIKRACKILKVSTSGYYEYLGRRKSNSQIEREALEGFVADIFAEHKGRYGARRISKVLNERGILASHKRIAKVLSKLGLQAKGTRKKYRQSRKIAAGDPRMNLVEQVFNVKTANRLWVGDITYIPTQSGFLYLAVVVDTFSRKIVGWSMSTRMLENLVIDALEQAVGRENIPENGLVFHSDQGTQYTSRAFQKSLKTHGIEQSVSRPGNPYDNAVAESFFKTIKRELVKGKNFGSQEEARQEVFKYIELYYNTKRMHSYLGYMSPVAYECTSNIRNLNHCPI